MTQVCIVTKKLKIIRRIQIDDGKDTFLALSPKDWRAYKAEQLKARKANRGRGGEQAS